MRELPSPAAPPWPTSATSPAPPSSPALQTLSKHGYLYDATLIERWASWSPTSPSAAEMLWPYTMDAGIPQVRQGGRQGAWSAAAGLGECGLGRAWACRGMSRWLTPSPPPPPPPQDCGFMGADLGQCVPGEAYAGLWELPLYQLQEGDLMYGVSSEWMATAWAAWACLGGGGGPPSAHPSPAAPRRLVPDDLPPFANRHPCRLW